MSGPVRACVLSVVEIWEKVIHVHAFGLSAKHTWRGGDPKGGPRHTERGGGGPLGGQSITGSWHSGMALWRIQGHGFYTSVSQVSQMLFHGPAPPRAHPSAGSPSGSSQSVSIPASRSISYCTVPPRAHSSAGSSKQANISTCGTQSSAPGQPSSGYVDYNHHP